MAKSKTRASNYPVPQSKEQAAEQLKQIGEAMREIARIEADFNDELAALKAKAEALAIPLRERKEALVEGLRVWADANREALTQNHKTKTVDLGTGLVLWRTLPPAVRLRFKADDILHYLKDMSLGRFIRVKEEVNKEAMLADPEAAKKVPGVTIGSGGEDFVVEPLMIEIEGARS